MNRSQQAARNEQDILAACEHARRNPTLYLGMESYYRHLVRTNMAGRALASAVNSGAQGHARAVIAALATAVEHATRYHATMTERRRRAIAAVERLEAEVAAAHAELAAAEAADGCWAEPSAPQATAAVTP